MDTEKKTLGTAPYVIAGLSFVPGIGIVFGIIAVVWGLATQRSGGRKIAVLGCCGVGLSVVLYSSLFYFGFVQRGGVYDGLRRKMAESTLITLVQAIEFYKIQHGQYPDTLETLNKSMPKGSMVFVFDPTDTRIGGTPRYFYYELVDESHYYLLGVGPDGKPFTNDDILPKIDPIPGGHVGLLIKKGS